MVSWSATPGAGKSGRRSPHIEAGERPMSPRVKG
jgi:hypothetical protein